MARTDAYDWIGIKRLYIEGEPDPSGREGTLLPTLLELATRFGIHESTMNARCRTEGWLDQRKEYQRKLDDLRRAKRMEALANQQADVDERVLTTANGLIAMVIARMEEFNKARQPQGRGKKPEPVDTRDMLRLTQALTNAHNIALKAMGVQTSSPTGQFTAVPGSKGTVTYEWVSNDPTAKNYD
jgi:hypothetical protein